MRGLRHVPYAPKMNRPGFSITVWFLWKNGSECDVELWFHVLVWRLGVPGITYDLIGVATAHVSSSAQWEVAIWLCYANSLANFLRGLRFDVVNCFYYRCFQLKYESATPLVNNVVMRGENKAICSYNLYCLAQRWQDYGSITHVKSPCYANRLPPNLFTTTRAHTNFS